MDEAWPGFHCKCPFFQGAVGDSGLGLHCGYTLWPWGLGFWSLSFACTVYPLHGGMNLGGVGVIRSRAMSSGESQGRSVMLAWGSRPRPSCPVGIEGIPSPAKLQILSALGHLLTCFPPWAAVSGGISARGQYDPQLGEAVTGHERNSREAEREKKENKSCEKPLSREEC